MTCLGDRYEYSDRPIIKMDAVQLQAKKTLLDRLKGERLQECPCAVCSRSEFDTLARRDRYGLPVTTVVCRTCGLVQTNPRMSQEAYNGFYDSVYRELYGGHKGDEDLFDYQRIRGESIIKFLEETVDGGIRKKSVVEIGCGPGGILQVFKERGNRVYGVDLDSASIAVGRAKGLDIDVGSLSTMPAREKPDLIIYCHVLEHIVDPLAELRMLQGYMKKGTLVYIEVPGIKNLMASYNQDFLKYIQIAHVHHFSIRTLTNLAQKAGLWLLDGDERIKSLFVGMGEIDEEFESDYRDVTDYLAGLEAERQRPFNLFRMKNTLAASTVSLTKKVGVYGAAKRLYRKYGDHTKTSNFDR